MVQRGSSNDSAVQYEGWFAHTRRHFSNTYTDWRLAWQREWNACSKVGLMQHVMSAIHESVLVLQKVYSNHIEAFPQAPKRQFRSPGYSTLLLHSIWTAFFDRCLVKLPTGEYVSPQYLESSSLVHYPTTVIALNRTIRDGRSYASCLTPIPEEWLVERDWYIISR